MKKLRTSILVKYIAVVAALMISMNVLAQGPDPLDDDPGAPLDGGVSLLVAAGVGYGVKKVRDMRKKKEEGSGK